MSNFLVETAIAKRDREDRSKYSAVPIIARMNTESVVVFSDYISNAVEHFSSMVEFDKNVEYVTMLVRVYSDHHIITISCDDTGNVDVRSNQ